MKALVVFVLLASPAVVGAADSVSIGGVSLGQKRAEVEAHLGPPQIAIPTGTRFYTRLVYSDFTVWLDELDVVGAVESRNKRHCASVGVCPGDLALTAAKRLGILDLPGDAKSVPDGEYQGSGEGACYTIIVRKSSVASIATADCYE